MRIWIVNYYTGNPDKVSNPRYVVFAKHFMAKGWDVITFNANHINIGAPLFERKQYSEYEYVHVKAPNYVGNGLKRMWSIFMFAWTLYRHASSFEKPDVVLHNIHMPFDYPIVWMCKRLKSKYIAEAWDVWPEDFVASGLLSANNPIMRFAYWVEKKCYYNADALIFTYLGSKTRLKEKGWTTETGGRIEPSSIHYINNGVNLLEFDEDVKKHPRPDCELKRDDITKIVYLGSINGANQVDTLIEAADLLKNEKKYKFYIYGDGSKREELERMVHERNIPNVYFMEKRIPFKEVAWVVSQATINVMNYEKGFGRWGVSSGKMFQYLAAGKPIICNVDIKYDNVIKDNNLGICRDLYSESEYAEAIKNLAEQSPEEYEAMCRRVRHIAEQFDYNKLSQKEISVIQALFENKNE